MKSLHEKMSREDLERFPRRLGWKHEYYDGKIHLTPSHTASVVLKLELAPRPTESTWSVRPVRAGDETSLIALFQDAFAHTIYYVDYSPTELRRAAQENVQEFFDDPKRVCRQASFVAAQDDNLMGAALIRKRPLGPLLEPIFVAPSFQRRGVATAVMKRVVAKLCRMNQSVLYSQCHLGNEASLAWHVRFGFQELPDLFVAQHRCVYFHSEAERYRRLSCNPADIEHLARQAAYWKGEADRLQHQKASPFAVLHVWPT